MTEVGALFISVPSMLVCTIGHVPKTLTFKMRLGAQSFL